LSTSILRCVRAICAGTSHHSARLDYSVALTYLGPRTGISKSRKAPAMSAIPAPLAPIRHAFGWSLTMAILLILAGMAAIAVPMVSGVAITLIVGWFFTLAGVFHLLFAWKTHTTSGVLLEILLGFLYIFSGIYLLFHPLFGLVSLTFFLAGYLLFKGIVEIVHFFRLQPRHGSWWLLFDAIVNLVLAVLIWRSWPSSSLWVVGTLVGISLLFTGFSRLMLTLTVRRALAA
jgi:uncharacterized membrane protein HdeD (DUF308 family)